MRPKLPLQEPCQHPLLFNAFTHETAYYHNYVLFLLTKPLAGDKSDPPQWSVTQFCEDVWSLCHLQGS